MSATDEQAEGRSDQLERSETPPNDSFDCLRDAVWRSESVLALVGRWMDDIVYGGGAKGEVDDEGERWTPVKDREFEGALTVLQYVQEDLRRAGEGRPLEHMGAVRLAPFRRE